MDNVPASWALAVAGRDNDRKSKEAEVKAEVEALNKDDAVSYTVVAFNSCSSRAFLLLLLSSLLLKDDAVGSSVALLGVVNFRCFLLLPAVAVAKDDAVE